MRLDRRLASAALAAWLSAESFVLGPASYLQIHDSADGVIPYSLAAVRGALRFGRTHWFPWMGAGVDRLANDIQLLSLRTMLLGVLPAWLAIAALRLLHSAALVWFTAALAREEAGLDEDAAVLSGVAAALCCRFALGFQLGFSAIPAAIWALHRILRESRGSRRLVLACLAGLVFACASSAAVTLPFALWAVFLWFAVARPQPLAAAPVLAAFAGAAVAPHVPGIVAMLANAGAAHRLEMASMPSAASTVAAHLGSALLLLVPILLAPRAALAQRRSQAMVYASLLFLLTDLFLVWQKSLPWASFLRGVNLRFSPAAFIFFVIPAAAAVQRSSAARRGLLVALGVGLLATVGEKASVAGSWLYEGSYASNFRSPVLRELAGRAAAEPPFRVATFSYGLHPAYAQAYGLETIDGYMNLYPRTFKRYWSAVIAPALAEDPAVRDVFLGWGNRVYLFGDAIQRDPYASIDLARHADLRLLSLANVRFIISKAPLAADGLRLLRGPAQRWDELPRRQRLLRRLRENAFGRVQLFVYENAGALPRAFVAASTGSLSGFSAAHAIMRGSQAAIDAYSPDRLTVSIDAPRAGTLVVSNSLSPFWTCRVDGIPAAIEPAFEAFWGVRVAAGRHSLAFDYTPPYP